METVAVSNFGQLIGMSMVPFVALAAAAILLTCFAIIMRMDCRTNHLIRIYYTTIATGAFGELCAMVTGKLPTIHEFLLVVGVGLLFLFDRRSGFRARPECCECPQLRKMKGQ